jgi:hypothetical protein
MSATRLLNSTQAFLNVSPLFVSMAVDMMGRPARHIAVVAMISVLVIQ